MLDDVWILLKWNSFNNSNILKNKKKFVSVKLMWQVYYKEHIHGRLEFNDGNDIDTLIIFNFYII